MVKPSYTYYALITNIVDGDTVDAEVDLGFRLKAKLRLRFCRVNTAEMKASDKNERALAVSAKEFTSNALINKSVIIITTKTDSFGRYLAEVFYEKNGQQVCINDELINSGLARLYK